MKKIILASLLAGVALFGLTSCEDDNDSNPTVKQPDTFVLNTPALAVNVYDLENSDSITFTCSQPDYGYTASVTYILQISTNGSWDEVEGDATPNYYSVTNTSTTAMIAASAAEINTDVLKLKGYTDEASVEDSVRLYVRMMAQLSSGYPCYSNVVQIVVHPYYQVLTSADPELWYLIGGAVGDGSWGSEIGTSVYPMSPVAGADYDAATGKGPLTYTGYFPADGEFKIVKTPGEWADQWGATDGDITKPYLKDAAGEGGNFKITEAGYYDININTLTNTCSVTKSSATPSEYSVLYISGSFNEWGTDTEMSPVDTYAGAINHIWKYTLTIDSDAEVKFLNTDWSPNWGAAEFPYGWGVNNGANIPAAAGSYTVIFNDIDGYYHFFSNNE